MNILAIGAHPDDIEYGCGGTLLKYVQQRHQVNLLVLTEGGYGGDAAVRRKEQEESCRYMQAKELFWGDFSDTELGGNRQVILKIEQVIKIVAPDMVFLNHPEDVHQDHRVASQAGVSASRYVREVLFYEVPTTEYFQPDIFVDIQSVLQKKIELLGLHSSQVFRTRVENLSILESANSCANFRGFQGRVKFAEGFKALRVLKDIA